MKSPTRSPAIRRLTAEASKLGYSVAFEQYLESGRTPGILGRLAGVCDHERKVIRVRTAEASRAQIAAVIEHELEHAAGATRGADRPEFGLRCGGTTSSFV